MFVDDAAVHRINRRSAFPCAARRYRPPERLRVRRRPRPLRPSQRRRRRSRSSRLHRTRTHRFFRAEDVSTSHAATRAHRNQLALFLLFFVSSSPPPSPIPSPRPDHLPTAMRALVASLDAPRARRIFFIPRRRSRARRLRVSAQRRAGTSTRRGDARERFRRPGRPRVRAHATRQGGRVVDDDGKDQGKRPREC